MSEYPSFEEFLAAPIEEIRQVVPATVIMTNGGTRRRAVLAGIAPDGDGYPKFIRGEMLKCLELLFQYGVRHIVTTALSELNYSETTKKYREKLVSWTCEGLAGKKALADYEQRQWRVRLVGTESWPELMPAAKRLRDATSDREGPTVWFTVASHSETRWELIFQAVREKCLSSRAEVIRAVYGEDIPLAEIYIGSGKPQIFASIVPPLLSADLQCYWNQHLGYDLDELTLRSILYDFAYLRRTWRNDKADRAQQALRYKATWDDPPVVGLGMRLGPFWYPAPISDPRFEDGVSPYGPVA